MPKKTASIILAVSFLVIFIIPTGARALEKPTVQWMWNGAPAGYLSNGNVWVEYEFVQKGCLASSNEVRFNPNFLTVDWSNYPIINTGPTLGLDATPEISAYLSGNCVTSGAGYQMPYNDFLPLVSVSNYWTYDPQTPSAYGGAPIGPILGIGEHNGQTVYVRTPPGGIAQSYSVIYSTGAGQEGGVTYTMDCDFFCSIAGAVMDVISNPFANIALTFAMGGFNPEMFLSGFGDFIPASVQLAADGSAVSLFGYGPAFQSAVGDIAVNIAGAAAFNQATVNVILCLTHLAYEDYCGDGNNDAASAANSVPITVVPGVCSPDTKLCGAGTDAMCIPKNSVCCASVGYIGFCQNIPDRYDCTATIPLFAQVEETAYLAPGVTVDQETGQYFYNDNGTIKPITVGEISSQGTYSISCGHVDVSCSADSRCLVGPPPTEPPCSEAYTKGLSCVSKPNKCGMVSSAKYVCDGSCDPGAIPLDSLCLVDDPKLCPDGRPKPPSGICPIVVVPNFCPDGSPKPASGKCPGVVTPPSAPSITEWEVAPRLVRSGEPAFVSWSAEDVSDCTVSGTDNKTWTGKTGAKVQSDPIFGQTVFSISCEALPGASPAAVSKPSITVNLIPTFQEL